MLNRREIRQLNFMLLYQLPFYDEANYDKIFDRFSNFDLNCLEIERKDSIIKDLPQNQLEEIKSNYLEIVSNLNNIDQTIQKNLIKWKIERINKVDLAILRFAAYEISNPNIPNEIVVYEAVNLAKIYSDEQSANFINAILHKILETKN